MKPLKNRIDKTFSLLREKAKKALIIYITAGDPDIRATLALMHGLADAGADMIELGVPFSDPMGDGVVNQRAAERAIKAGANLKKILDCAAEFREKNSETPLIIFSYLNPVYRFGYKKFASLCAVSGIDGCLFVDMPADEETPLQDALKDKDIHTIFLATPETDETRLKYIAKRTKGFLYAVSSLGVTGQRKGFDKGFDKYLCNLRKVCNQPVCVGFGISTPDMARKASLHSDGVIVGSAVVSRVEKNSKHKKKMFKEVCSFVRSIRKAF